MAIPINTLLPGMTLQFRNGGAYLKVLAIWDGLVEYEIVGVLTFMPLEEPVAELASRVDRVSLFP